MYFKIMANKEELVIKASSCDVANNDVTAGLFLLEHDKKNESPLRNRKLGQRLKEMREKLNLSLDSSAHSRRSLLDDSSLIEATNCSLNSSTISLLLPHEKSPAADSTFETFYKVFRDDVIRKELKLLSQHHQDGIYVIPSVASLQVWFGVVFVRDGPYQNGIFHFTVYFKDDYPESIPVIRFRNRIFHPQVEIRKGTFNTKLLEVMRTTHVWQLLKQLRSSFIHLDIQNGTNERAVAIFKTDQNRFVNKCQQCVRRSLDAFEEQTFEGVENNFIENPFQSSLIEDNFCKGFVNFLVANDAANNQNGSGSDNVIGWARNQLGRVLNNLNTSYSFMEENE